MERTKENVVSCYFTYMQDGWCEEECRTIFGARAEAVWIMWCKNLSAGASGSGLFYLALDKDDKIRLVDEPFDSSKNGSTTSRSFSFAMNAARVRYR